MKRFFSILIFFSYTLASLGLGVSFFYCCGKLKSISLTTITFEKKCSDKSGKGCCKNQVVTINLKVDQKGTDWAVYQIGSLSVVPIIHSSHYSAIAFSGNCSIDPLYKRPPPDKLPSRQILFSVFRI